MKELMKMFEKKMVLGTIMYGTLFNVNGNQFFSVENIHFYKGEVMKDNIVAQMLIYQYVH